MRYPSTFWLTATNIALGLALVLLIAGVATGVLCDFVAKLMRRRAVRAGLDKEMQRMFGTRPHPRV